MDAYESPTEREIPFSSGVHPHVTWCERAMISLDDTHWIRGKLGPMTTDDNEKLIERVRALLAKAEGTDNTHEAEAFFAKAAELMEKYRIDEAAVRDVPRGITRVTFELAGYRHLRASLALLGAVGKHYGVVTLVPSTGNSKNPTLAGDPVDIDAAIMMFRSLVIQRDRACLSEPVTPGVAVTTFRNSFAYGFAVRINARLKEIRDAATHTAEGSTGAALEVFGRLDRTLSELGNPSPRNTNRPTVDRSGAGSGDRAARNADLGQSRIGSNAGPRAIGA